MIEIALFLQIAERVLDIDADRLKNVTKIGSAESALAAPFASLAATTSTTIRSNARRSLPLA